MYAVGRLGGYITRGVYTVSVPFHSLGGAVDIIVVEQPDGSCKSSPWYVRLGKFQGALKPKEKVVNVSVNGVEADFHMYLDYKGEAYFLREVDDDAEESVLCPSSSSDETDGQSQDRRRRFKSKSFNFDTKSPGLEIDSEIPNGKIGLRSNSHRSKILGLFGRKVMKNDADPNEDSGYGVVRTDSLERAEIAADLLEVKWATDLATRKLKKFNSLERRADKNIHNSVEESLVSSSMEDNCDSHDDKNKQNSLSNYGNPDSVLEETNAEVSSLSSSNHGVENSLIGDALFEGKCEMIYEKPVQIDELSLETTTRNGYEKENNLEMTQSNELIHMEQLSGSEGKSTNSEATTRKLPSCSESVGDRVLTKASSMPPSICSDEKPLKFHDWIQESKSTYMQHIYQNNHLSVHNGETEEGNTTTDRNFESFLSPESLNQENSPAVHEKSIDKPTFPIMIPQSHNCFGLEDTRMIKSLPNTGNSKENAAFLSGPHRHSWDSNVISMKLMKSRKDKTSLETEGEQEQQSVVASTVLGVLNTTCGNSLESTFPPSESWRIWPFSLRNSRSMKKLNICQDLRNTDAEYVTEEIMNMDKYTEILEKKPEKKKARAIAPTSEQLESLNLKEGRNTVTFWFSTPSLGKKQVDARIFLWKWNTRIVISDVDGTITKSDVLGQFMPLVGIDWSQMGVAHLFSAIKENGYQMLFLSARSISQAYLTRQFLINLKQDGKVLPEGPIIISPDGLLPSLYREVIRRAPHEFKIACLEKIRELFPPDSNPFYAGFGNRDTDEISYVKVGVPRGKIFIINPKGEVAVNRCIDTKSYVSYHSLVNNMFPPTTSIEQEDYNTWNYWKLPLPVIDY